jgi:hypothetical protein
MLRQEDPEVKPLHIVGPTGVQEEVGRKKKWVFKTVTESSAPGIVKKRMEEEKCSRKSRSWKSQLSR